ncbi:MAG: zinc-ribbon domain-containing protein [Actinobacteria bacterium]|nr:MAG: zinc-ribbon domain-containing protein [Actinomycetota bacterium]
MDSSGVICPSCGRENPADSRFCSACGAPLAAEAPVGVRKTVTVVFCDLVGSTALGEATDPEVLRELMGRYHAELRSILERHGGTVEKFVGGRALQRDQRRARSQRRPPQRGGLAVSSRQGLRGAGRLRPSRGACPRSGGDRVWDRLHRARGRNLA